MNLIWSPSAATDLEAIRNYIAADSPRYADLVVRRILLAIERLSGVATAAPAKWTSGP